jgi:hypothetical protein
MMRDTIKILEQDLADIEHLEIGLLQALSEQTTVASAPDEQLVNKRTTDMKQRLLKRIAALKASKNR